MCTSGSYKKQEGSFEIWISITRTSKKLTSLNMRRALSIKSQLRRIEEDQEFKRTLLEAIDESLRKTLGETATQIIYFHLKMDHHLKQEDIPDNLDDFLFHLERIFENGALMIEKAIMENLYSRLSLTKKDLSLEYRDRNQFNFVDYITDLRTICINQGANASSASPRTFLRSKKHLLSTSAP